MQCKPQSELSGHILLSPDKLNSFMNSRQSFSLKKHDISTTVGILHGNIFGLHTDLLVKRFNYKGFFDFIYKTLFASKAKLLWDINLRLYDRGLPVPVPIAYVKETWKHRYSFFISSYIDHSDNLGSIYKKGLLDESEEFAQALGKTIAEWHLSGAVHGDLKWSNILVQEKEDACRFFFIDLDRAKLYSSPCIKGIMKDLIRFYRYGLELNAGEWVELMFLPVYMALIPGEIQTQLDLVTIKKRARKDWYKKGRRMFRPNN